MRAFDAATGGHHRTSAAAPRTATPLAFTIRQTTEVAGIGRTTVYGLIKGGQLRAMKSGARTLVCAESLRSYLDSLPTIAPKQGGA
jgi:excisionase family DNA binding protein